jgi:hypothetical protein
MPKYEYSVKEHEPNPKLTEPTELKYRNLDLPIIDIVRHASSNMEAEGKIEKNIRVFRNGPVGYQKLRGIVREAQKHNELDKNASQQIKELVTQLREQIDTTKEIIFVVASPTPRAWQTAELFTKYLSQDYPEISIVNQSEIFEGWLLKGGKQVKQFLNDSNLETGTSSLTPAYDMEEKNFNRFIRHAVNFKKYLNPKQLETIKDKKVRLVCFAHEETTYRLASKIFGKQANGDYPSQENTQIYELVPFEENSNSSFNTSFTMMPYKGNAAQARNITFNMNEVK